MQDRYECRKEAHDLAGEQRLAAVPLALLARDVSPGVLDFAREHGAPTHEEYTRILCMRARGYKFMMPNEID